MRQSESKLLNALVQDCILWKLTLTDSLEYIKTRLGHAISAASYNRRKSHILSEGSLNVWLNQYTRIGYLSSHKQDIETITKIRDDSMRQLQIETQRPVRDEYKILKLKYNIIETTKLLSELNLGTPIIAAIKAKLQQQKKSESEENFNESFKPELENQMIPNRTLQQQKKRKRKWLSNTSN